MSVATLKTIATARQTVGERVAANLIAVESTSIQAAMDMSLIVASVLEAHRTACLPPSVGMAAIELLSEASHLAAQSRARIGAAHDMLRDIAQAHNIPVASVPGCPPNEPATVFAPFVGA